jgi:hypothetical protein
MRRREFMAGLGAAADGKVDAASIALAASPALAHPWHGGHHGWRGHHGGGYGWGPAVGLGIAGALFGGALAFPSYAQPECWMQYDQWGQAYRVCR